nr:Uncharacterised protein [Klebsiella pneumoniae]
MVSSWTVVEDIAAGRLIELFPQWRPASLPVHLVYPRRAITRHACVSSST